MFTLAVCSRRKSLPNLVGWSTGSAKEIASLDLCVHCPAMRTIKNVTTGEKQRKIRPIELRV